MKPIAMAEQNQEEQKQSKLVEEESILNSSTYVETSIKELENKIDSHFEGMRRVVEKFKTLSQRNPKYFSKNGIDYDVYTASKKNAEEIIDGFKLELKEWKESIFEKGGQEKEQELKSILVKVEVFLERQKLVFEEKINGEDEEKSIEKFMHVFSDFGTVERIDHKLIGLDENFTLKKRSLKSIKIQIIEHLLSIENSTEKFMDIVLGNKELFSQPDHFKTIALNIEREVRLQIQNYNSRIEDAYQRYQDKSNIQNEELLRDELIKIEWDCLKQKKIFEAAISHKKDEKTLISFLNIFHEHNMQGILNSIDLMVNKLSHYNVLLRKNGYANLTFFKNEEMAKTALSLAWKEVQEGYANISYEAREAKQSLELEQKKLQEKLQEKVNNNLKDIDEEIELCKSKQQEAKEEILKAEEKIRTQYLEVSYIWKNIKTDPLKATLEYISLNPRGRIILLQEEVTKNLELIEQLKKEQGKDFDNARFDRIKNNWDYWRMKKHEKLAVSKYWDVQPEEVNGIMSSLTKMNNEAIKLLQELQETSEDDSNTQITKVVEQAKEPKTEEELKIYTLKEKTEEILNEISNIKDKIVVVCEDNLESTQNLFKEMDAVNISKAYVEEQLLKGKSLLSEINNDIEEKDFKKAKEKLDDLKKSAMKLNQQLKSIDHSRDENSVTRKFIALTEEGEIEHLRIKISHNIYKIHNLSIKLSKIALNTINETKKFSINLLTSSMEITNDKVTLYKNEEYDILKSEGKKANKDVLKAKLQKLEHETQNTLRELELIDEKGDKLKITEEFIKLDPLSVLYREKEKIKTAIENININLEKINANIYGDDPINFSRKPLEKKEILFQDRKMENTLVSVWINNQIKKADSLEIPGGLKEDQKRSEILELSGKFKEIRRNTEKILEQLNNVRFKKDIYKFTGKYGELSDKISQSQITKSIENRLAKVEFNLNKLNKEAQKLDRNDKDVLSSLIIELKNNLYTQKKEYSKLIESMSAKKVLNNEIRINTAKKLHEINDKLENLEKVLSTTLFCPDDLKPLYEFAVEQDDISKNLVMKIDTRLLVMEFPRVKEEPHDNPSFGSSLEKWISHNFAEKAPDSWHLEEDEVTIQKDIQFREEFLKEQHSGEWTEFDERMQRLESGFEDTEVKHSEEEHFI